MIDQFMGPRAWRDVATGLPQGTQKFLAGHLLARAYGNSATNGDGRPETDEPDHAHFGRSYIDASRRSSAA
jgi:hypothetical protein